MALKDDTTNAAPQFQTPPPQQAQPTGQKKAWGFFSLPTSAGMSRTPASEVLTKAMKAIGEVFTNELRGDLPYIVDIIPVDNAKETRLTLSAVVVCARSKANPGLGVSYHTLLLEGSGEPIPDRVENINNRQVTISYFAADVFTKTYQETVMAIVQRAFPGKPVYGISGQVVPRSFNWEDKETLRVLAANASFPSLTDLEVRGPDFVDIDLTAFQKDANLQVRLNFNEADRVDYAGLPVRNNLSIELVATEMGKPAERGVGVQDRSKKVSSMGGYVDLMWAPEQPQTGYGYGQAPQGPQHKFAARYVITNMENLLRMTLPAQLLALCTALCLSEGTSWYPYYTPRPVGAGGKTVDFRNIGAINIEANLFNDPSGYGAPVDTKAASFTKLNLGALIQGSVRPGITVSLDVSDLGSDTWCNEAFAEAADGNPRAAISILEAANFLTGGIFAKHYTTNENPMVVNEDRVHLGHYPGTDGQRHDVRDIDHLAVLNLRGQDDPQAAQAFSDTFFRTEYPLAQRLDQRKKIISELLRDQAVFTGMARRVTPTQKFLIALATACREAGLDARLVSPALTGGYEDQRGVATFLPQSLLMPGSVNIFAPGYGNTNSATAYGQRVSSGRY